MARKLKGRLRTASNGIVVSPRQIEGFRSGAHAAVRGAAKEASEVTRKIITEWNNQIYNPYIAIVDTIEVIKEFGKVLISGTKGNEKVIADSIQKHVRKLNDNYTILNTSSAKFHFFNDPKNQEIL